MSSRHLLGSPLPYVMRTKISVSISQSAECFSTLVHKSWRRDMGIRGDQHGPLFYNVSQLLQTRARDSKNMWPGRYRLIMEMTQCRYATCTCTSVNAIVRLPFPRAPGRLIVLLAASGTLFPSCVSNDFAQSTNKDKMFQDRVA
jgi:hypothetical protein